MVDLQKKRSLYNYFYLRREIAKIMIQYTLDGVIFGLALFGMTLALMNGNLWLILAFILVVIKGKVIIRRKKQEHEDDAYEDVLEIMLQSES